MAVGDEEVLARYPYRIDHDTKAFWKGCLQRKLLVNRCQDCGHWILPMRPLCSQCWSDRVEAHEVTGKGAVHLFTLVHQGPAVPGFEHAGPYPIAAVELEEQDGLRLPATIVNCAAEDIRIGMPVELTWIERNGAPIAAFQPAP